LGNPGVTDRHPLNIYNQFQVIISVLGLAIVLLIAGAP
jgi:hypothetical protein